VDRAVGPVALQKRHCVSQQQIRLGSVDRHTPYRTGSCRATENLLTGSLMGLICVEKEFLSVGQI